MKKILFLSLISLFISTICTAQVKIGEQPETLHPNSVLELQSTNRTLVITRVTTSQMNAIIPLQGALIYNTDLQCVHYFDGTAWVNMCNANNSSNISLVDNNDGTFTFTNENGDTTNFTIPTFSANYTGNMGLTSGLKMTTTGNNINYEVNIIHGQSNIQAGTVTEQSIADNAINNTKLQDNSVKSLEIDNQTIKPEDIEPALANQVLMTNASETNVEWVNLNSGIISGQDLTTDDNSISITNGTGTLLNAASISVSDGGITEAKLDKSNIRLSGFDLPILPIDMNGNRIINTADPTSQQDVATKNYVDSQINASNQVVVSADANNSITTSGTDGGAFYDDTAIQTNIATNTTDIGTNQTAIATNTTTIGTKENAANKSSDITLADGTNTKFPTELAVKTYVDGQIATVTADGDITSSDLTVTGGTDAALNDITLEIAAGVVGTTELADNAVTTAKIADDAVTTAKVLDANITTAKIADNAVTTAKVADDAIDKTKINADVAGVGLTQNLDGSLEIDPNGAINIASTNLTQTASTNRTYDINNGNLIFNGNGNVKIGNLPAPTHKLEVEGTITSQKILNAVGNPMAPAYSFLGDEDTGMYREDANELVFSAGGMNSMSIVNDPLYGIHMNIRSSVEIFEKLFDENGSSGNSGDVLTATSSGTQWTAISIDTGDISNNAVTSSKILNGTIVDADVSATAAIAGTKINPNFGAQNVVTTGTVAAGNTSVTGTLGVAGQTTINVGANATTLPTDQGTANQVLTTNGAGVASWADVANPIPTVTAGSIFFSNGAGGLIENSSELFWDNTNDRLGIGVTGPTHTIHTNGSVRAQRGFLANDGTLGEPAFRFFDDTNTGINSPFQDQITFLTNGTEAIRIGNNQNVGIGNFTPTGNTNPNSTLEIKGSLATAIERINGIFSLDETQHTIIITGASTITLPPVLANIGRIYIIKNPTFVVSVTGAGYTDLAGTTGITGIASNETITLQSDGVEWQQIN